MFVPTTKHRPPTLTQLSAIRTHRLFSSFSRPVPNRTNTGRRFRPASEPYRARPFAVSWAAMTGHPLIRPFVHGTAGKVPLGIINAYGPPPHRTDYPMNIHEAVTPKRQRQIIKRKTGRRNAAGRAATGSLQKKKSPQECIPRRLMENCRIVIRTLSGSVSLRAHATHCLPRLQARSRPA